MRFPTVLAAATQGNRPPQPSKKKTPSVLRVATGIVVSKPAHSSKPPPTHHKRNGQPDAATPKGSSMPSPASNTKRAPPNSRPKPSRPSSTPDTPLATAAAASRAAEQLKAITSTPSVDLPLLPLTWAEFQKATSTATQQSAKAARQSSLASQRPAAAADSAPSGFGYLGNAAALRVFRYAVERERLETALRVAGLQDDVELVEDIGLADAVVAMKATNSGKHVNIGQGERTAINAGIPFIVLGRKVSAEGISTALRPLLLKKAADAQ